MKHELDPVFAGLPAKLRELLVNEQAEGNQVVEIRCGFPAPPNWACFMLSQPLLKGRDPSNDGLSCFR
jgi:hypothetical protein